jgi:cytochrome c-type biogenesis protein CcmH
MRFLFALLLLAGLGGTALAVSDPAELMHNPAQEARAEQIGRQLRCLVCQNEDIEDSGADLARDLRRIVRVQVAEGRTNRQIMDWMVARYGNFVRLAPPMTAATLLLWGMPALALLVGFGAVVVGLRRVRAPGPAPLTDRERELLAEITARR